MIIQPNLCVFFQTELMEFIAKTTSGAYVEHKQSTGVRAAAPAPGGLNGVGDGLKVLVSVARARLLACCPFLLDQTNPIAYPWLPTASLQNSCILPWQFICFGLAFIFCLIEDDLFAIHLWFQGELDGTDASVFQKAFFTWNFQHGVDGITGNLIKRPESFS